MRRRLFLDWFVRAATVVVAAPRELFVQPVNADDVMWDATKGEITHIITAGNMGQLAPGGTFPRPDGKLTGFRESDVLAAELYYMGQNVTRLFSGNDTFYKAIEKLDPIDRRPKQMSLFDGVKTTPIVESDDEEWWEDE